MNRPKKLVLQNRAQFSVFHLATAQSLGSSQEKFPLVEHDRHASTREKVISVGSPTTVVVWHLVAAYSRLALASISRSPSDRVFQAE